MNRREFTMSCLGALALAGSTGLFADRASGKTGTEEERSGKESGKRHISFVLFEGMTALDMIGPAAVLTGSGQFSVDYVWRDKNPVYAESNAGTKLALLPTATFEDIRETDILCVPGTSNPYIQIAQKDMVEWVAQVGATASWVTSVCTGSFLLGAAGLLKGYKATAHWTMVEELKYFGAIPVFERVVVDRNRVTGAGVTSGIDFGLVLLARLCGEDVARRTQLMLEYDPAPPFSSGSPKSASPELVAAARKGFMDHVGKNMPYARANLEEAAARLGVSLE